MVLPLFYIQMNTCIPLRRGGMRVYARMRHYVPEAIGVFCCVGLGMLSGVGVASEGAWYNQLVKAPFHPPSFVFAPVWNTLYTLMGVAGGRIWRMRHRRPWWFELFSLQFLLNIAWTPLFFMLHRIDLALYDIVLLWSCLMIMLVLMRRDKLVFWLLVPYAMWTTFAVVLNYMQCMLNCAL